MKLSTLLDYQKAFDALRADERQRGSLESNNFVQMIKAKTNFDFELEQITRDIKVEVETDWRQHE